MSSQPPRYLCTAVSRRTSDLKEGKSIRRKAGEIRQLYAENLTVSIGKGPINSRQEVFSAYNTRLQILMKRKVWGACRSPMGRSCRIRNTCAVRLSRLEGAQQPSNCGFVLITCSLHLPICAALRNLIFPAKCNKVAARLSGSSPKSHACCSLGYFKHAKLGLTSVRFGTESIKSLGRHTARIFGCDFTRCYILPSLPISLCARLGVTYAVASSSLRWADLRCEHPTHRAGLYLV